MEHKDVDALMERWAAKAAEERSSRKLVLHTEIGMPATNQATRNTTLSLPVTRRKRLTGLLWAAASIAAALVVGLVIFTTPDPEAPVTCMVNGKPITDPARIEQYTREALELADETLRRPGVTLASTLGDEPTMTLVGEMLNELTKDQ